MRRTNVAHKKLFIKMTDSDPNMQANFSRAHSPAPVANRRVWSEWPSCSGCGAPRMTQCPGCGEATEEFRLAAYQETGVEMRSSRPQAAPWVSDRYPLLVCPTCDEQFRPKFYQECAWCGHVFDDGERVTFASLFRPLSRREWFAVAGLAGVLAVGLLWFTIVLRA
ncbi:MAG: hypothetical protein ACIALR_12645 [Blastopirellula sp. JB062]